ncbi:alpha/beta-hydrolase [Trichoderma sp. SZMC 28015]
MASNPPGPCCFTGFKHEGTPSGSQELIDGVKTYIARPQGDAIEKKAVIVISDVFGVSHNSMLLADDFAANGYFALLPDLLEGENLPLDVFETGSVDIPSWAARHSPTQVDPILDKIVNYLRSNQGIERIAGAGYCFGGKYTARFLKEGKLDVGYAAHPSYITFEELESIEKPFSIAAAEIDHIFTRDLRHKSEDTLIGTQKPYQINLFSGVAHGFAVRGDLTKSLNRFSKEQAFLQAIGWFNEYL